MQKILMVALVLSTVLSSCKKDKDSAPPADAREKFVGTWKGDLEIVVPAEFQALIPPTLPRKVNVTYAYSKNPNNSNELLINATVDPAFQSAVEISNPLKATLNGSSYNYNEFNITFKLPAPAPPVITVKCIGTGTINADGKMITETGNWNYISLATGTWSSSLTKQP